MGRLLIGILSAVVLALPCQASSPPPDFNGRPRGVAKSKMGFYDSSKPFTCLDGSRTMPYSHVNDDFCDCSDGSDEPGTPACSSLGGRFHCANKGHKPAYIPGSRVNDGICDCCDGSDEYDGRVLCEDSCKELGAAAREEAKQVLETQSRGHQVRQEYSQQGIAKQTERQAEFASLESQLKEALAEADRLRALKEEAETPETDAKDVHKKAWEETKAAEHRVQAEAAFRDLDTDSDGSLTVIEIQVKIQFDKDQSGDVSEEEAKEWLGGELARDIEYFVSDLWKTVSDVYGKSGSEEAATPVPPTEDEEPTPVPASEDVVPPASEDATEESQEGEKIAADRAHHDNQHVDDGHHEEEEELPPPPPALDQFDAVRSNADDYNDDDDDDDDDYNESDFDDEAERQKYSNTGIVDASEEQMPEYDAATQELIRVADSARTAYNDADKKREGVQQDIDNLKKLLEVDLGPNTEFQPLQGNCYDFTDREYTYSMCPFDRVSQKPKHGGSETSLGTWGKWDGPDDNKYVVMKFENGLNCWNGPNRSGTVKLRCGESNQLISAAEPNRCEYLFEFITPAVCEPPPSGAGQAAESHDEL